MRGTTRQDTADTNANDANANDANANDANAGTSNTLNRPLSKDPTSTDAPPQASAASAQESKPASPATPLSRDDAKEMVQMLKLFADETRLCILSRLMGGESNVQNLCKHLGQTQPAVSHHLALLKDAGMIAMRRSGKHNFYRINAAPADRLLLAMKPLMASAPV